VRLAAGEARQQLAGLVITQLRAHGVDGGFDDLLAPGGAHHVAAHRGAVGLGGLDQHDLAVEALDLARLVGEPAAVGVATEGAEPVPRIERGEAAEWAATPRAPPAGLVEAGARRERVEADDEVEPAAGEQVQIGGGADASVDVAPRADPDRAVEARNRAGGGDGVGDLGVGRIEAAERDAAAGAVVAGDGPVVGVVDPALRHGAADDVLERVRRDEA
jgi:hypothetical protein